MARECKDTYGEPIIKQYGNITARIYHPILTEEERAIRMKRIHDAAARVLRIVLEKEEQQKEEQAKAQAAN